MKKYVIKWIMIDHKAPNRAIQAPRYFCGHDFHTGYNWPVYCKEEDIEMAKVFTSKEEAESAISELKAVKKHPALSNDIYEIVEL